MTATVASGATTRQGVEGLFLAAATQDMFKLHGEVDITADNPHRQLTKRELLEDIDKRGVISDFFPLKEKIKTFDGPEMLVVYDPTQSVNNSSFYLCTTTESMEEELSKIAYKRQKEALAKRRAMEAARAPPARTGGSISARTTVPAGQAGWITWGSETEIMQEQVSNNRPLIRYEFSRKREEFGSPYRFNDSEMGEGDTQCPPFKNPRPEVRLLELDQAVQAVPEYTDGAQQTAWFRKINNWTNTAPLRLTAEDRQAEVATREFAEFLHHATEVIEGALEQNEIIDILAPPGLSGVTEDDIAFGRDQEMKLKEVQNFTDHSPNFLVSALDWGTHGNKVILAVSLDDNRALSDRASTVGRDADCNILCWSSSDAMQAQYTLICPRTVTCFRFLPDAPSIVVAGLTSGHLVVFDVATRRASAVGKGEVTMVQANAAGGGSTTSRRGGGTASAKSRQAGSTSWHPALMSCTATSHSLAISSMLVLPNTNTSFPPGTVVTASRDGELLFWDIRAALARNTTEFDPILRLSPTGSIAGMPCPITRLELSRTVPLSILLATESGNLHAVKFEGSSRDNTTSLYGDGVHTGAINDLQRSPFFPDIYLTIGDWSVHVYKEGVVEPLVASGFANGATTVARWSPTRPSVFFVGCIDGNVQVWDLIDKSHSPALSQKVASSGSGITTMEFMPPQPPQQQHDSSASSTIQMLAIGDVSGVAHVMEIPHNLSYPLPNELKHTATMFEREVDRVICAKSTAEAAAISTSKDREFLNQVTHGPGSSAPPPATAQTGGGRRAFVGGPMGGAGGSSAQQQLQQSASTASPEELQAFEEEYRKLEQQLASALK